MTKRHSWRSVKARRVAAGWALHHDGKIAAPAQDFDAWQAADQDHDALYRRTAALWQDPLLAQALETMVKKPRRRPVRPPLLWLGAVAASLSAMWFGAPYLDAALHPISHLETAVGQRRVATLPDGSHLELNGDSRVAVDFRGGKRKLMLEKGECFFDVAHDESRPFIVRAGAAEVTVLGTAFDLELGMAGVTLAVYRGKVDFGPDLHPEQHQLALAGQRLRLTASTLQRDSDFDPSGGDWRDGWLDTDGIELARLVEQLKRRSAQPIEIKDNDLARLKISGRFRVTDANLLLGRLAALYHFRMTNQSGKIVIFR